MRTLLLASASQLAHDILSTWPEGTVTALDRYTCDVTDAVAVNEAVRAVRPELVINPAASHRVDDLETDPSSALAVNAMGAWNVAKAAAGAAVLWISTDYVFDGNQDQPYGENDRVHPLNAYGVSKAAGEMLVAQANPRHYVVRSTGLYGVAGASGKGGNFVETMLRLARDGRPIRVVGDQVLGPTSTADLARALWLLVQTERYGTYHVTNAGAVSWHDFAALAFRLCGLSPDLTSVTSAEYAAAARRPRYSVLANTELRVAGIPQPRSIEEALRDYLGNKGYLTT